LLNDIASLKEELIKNAVLDLLVKVSAQITVKSQAYSTLTSLIENDGTPV
jgi:hypothetical protein